MQVCPVIKTVLCSHTLTCFCSLSSGCFLLSILLCLCAAVPGFPDGGVCTYFLWFFFNYVRMPLFTTNDKVDHFTFHSAPLSPCIYHILLCRYATIYTMFPVFSLVLDEDVKPDMALLYPELYKDLTKVNLCCVCVFDQAKSFDH